MIELRRATLGWLRMVLAPNLVTGVLALLPILFAIGMLIAHHTVVGPFAQSLSNYSEALQGFVVSIAVLTAYYGLMRGWTFHPAMDFRYHEWLQASPWAPGSPLPKGPIAPVWQDGVFLTLATIFTCLYASQTPNPTASALAPTMAMAAGLAASWTAANFVTRNLFAVYGAALAIPVTTLVLYRLETTALAVGLVTGALVAFVGVLQGMKRYPWQVFPRDKNYVKRLLNPHDERNIGWQTMAAVGWPYTQLLKPPKGLRVSAWRAGIEAATVGAWFGLIGRSTEANDPEVAWAFLFQFGMFITIVKFVSNTILMCPKLCLGERIALRRPIIWRHDRLILEPLLVAAAMAVIAWGWFWLRPCPASVAVTTTAAVGVWLCRRLGASSAERFYTGPQMVAGIAPNAAFFKRLASPGA